MTTVEVAVANPRASRRRLLRKRFLRRPVAVASLAIILAFMTIGIFAPLVAPYGQADADFNNVLAHPSWHHLFGTDELGRDVFSRLVWGARLSFTVGFLATGFSLLVALPIGLLAGYYRGWVDSVIARVTDVMLAFPFVILAIGLAAILGPSLTTTTVALGIAGVPGLVRITRGETLALREADFVPAAVASGAGDATIVFRHILPNMTSTLLVWITVHIPRAIIGEATLSFLGLGVRVPNPSWGATLHEAQSYLSTAPRLAVYPGLTIVIVALAFNLLGDALRDVLDPADDAVTAPLLEVDELCVRFETDDGSVHAVDRLSFALAPGEVLGIVGESGCGKTVTCLSLLRLLPGAAVIGGRALFDGRDLLALTGRELRDVRGRQISFVFQEPATSLNPVFTVERQIGEVLRKHLGMSRRAARERTVELLRLVHIPAPERRLREYPHQLSGGMRQRVMIAMALACDPKLLIADEPTTALDVTTQAAILDLVREIRERLGTAILLITHDLGVVADIADRVLVLYAGRKVEEAPTAELFAAPQHPYTVALLGAVPRRGDGGRLREIPGRVRPQRELPVGCSFVERCSRAAPECAVRVPELEGAGHLVACFHPGPG